MDLSDSQSQPSQRLVSLDVLRGFDMFWIIGMEEIGAALGKATAAPWAQFMAHHLDHASWAGFRFLDLIFPLFVFISGVSAVFSCEKSLTTQTRSVVAWKLFKRALILYALGLFCYGFFSKGMDSVRWVGVLQRLAICGLAGGLSYLFMGWKARGLLVAALLLGYWALMSRVPVPGIGAGDLAEGRNLANWIDSQYLPGRKWDGNHDPEGLLSTLPAIATALLGILTGEWLRKSSQGVWQKAGGLALAGVLLVALGWAWSAQFPVIKKLWTSSYVLVAGGYSLLLLSTFLVLVDGLKWRRGFMPFLWIGMNPITLYLSHHVIDYEKVVTTLLGGPFGSLFGVWQPVLFASGSLVLSLILAWFLYSRKVFIRI